MSTRKIPSSEISCAPFDRQYLEQNKSMYNAAFRPMREAMDHIASCGYSEMIIHVAEWNQNAVQMYKNEGFEIVKTEEISV